MCGGRIELKFAVTPTNQEIRAQHAFGGGGGEQSLGQHGDVTLYVRPVTSLVCQYHIGINGIDNVFNSIASLTITPAAGCLKGCC